MCLKKYCEKMEKLIVKIFNNLDEAKKGRIISYEDALIEIGKALFFINHLSDKMTTMTLIFSYHKFLS